MKKITKITLSTLLASSLFTGCYDAVYQSIRNEVELEDAKVSGFINDFIRYKNTDGNEYVLTENGTILYKQLSKDGTGTLLNENQKHGSWKNGNKNLDTVSYNYFDAEFSGWFVYKMAADQKYIYAIAYQPEYNEESSRNVPKNIKLYYTDKIGGNWKGLDSINKLLKDYVSRLDEDNFMMDASVALFCTNTPNPSNRYAYIRIGGAHAYNTISTNKKYGNPTENKCAIVKLDGPDTVVDTEVTSPTESGWIALGTNGAGLNTISAAYFDGSVHFCHNEAFITDETKDSEATYIYTASGTQLYSLPVASFSTIDNVLAVVGEQNADKTYPVVRMNAFNAFLSGFDYCKPSEETEKFEIKDSYFTKTVDGVSFSDDYELVITSDGDMDSTIISICKTKNSILLGTNGDGIFRVVTKENKPNTKCSSFSTNAQSVMYDPYIVRALFCTDPSIGETELNSALYSSLQFKYTESSASADYDNVGLWSYYYDRGNWNRE